MYTNKMAFCLKANGKVLREHDDTVFVPFGTEYQISVKNLNTKRALVNIFVDGESATPSKMVVNPGQTIDLERFVKDLNQGNKFKFVERTAGIEAHRGIGMEDGLVRVSFAFAKNSGTVIRPLHSVLRGMPYTSVNSCPDSSSSQTWVTNGLSTSATSAASVSVSTLSTAGVTVPGSVSSQQFQSVSDFEVESDEHVMILRLVGENVTAPVTVKHRPRCVSCNHLNKALAKFCSECGTGLTII